MSLALCPLVSCAATTFLPAGITAAELRGVVDPHPRAVVPRALGYTSTRVSSPAPSAAARKSDLALFLKVKESLPIPPTTGAFRLTVIGMQLRPSIVACVIDGKVTVTNEDRSAVTILVGDQEFGTLAPGDSKTYDCSSSGPALRRVTVKGWPHMRASLFVGEVGVASQPNEVGAFTMTAPPGKYELQIIGESGVITTREIEVAKTDLELGRVSLPQAPSPGTEVYEDTPQKQSPSKAPPLKIGAAVRSPVPPATRSGTAPTASARKDGEP